MMNPSQESDSKEKDQPKRQKVKRPQIKTCYTAEEVKRLSDTELQICFRAIYCINALHCSHCKRSTSIDTNWLYAIRKKGEKYGLSSDVPIPKTCDKQLKKNEEVNPINNLAYNTMRSMTVSDTVKYDLLVWRKIEIEKMGIKTKPRVYKV